MNHVNLGQAGWYTRRLPRIPRRLRKVAFLPSLGGGDAGVARDGVHDCATDRSTSDMTPRHVGGDHEK